MRMASPSAHFGWNNVLTSLIRHPTLRVYPNFRRHGNTLECTKVTSVPFSAKLRLEGTFLFVTNHFDNSRLTGENSAP